VLLPTDEFGIPDEVKRAPFASKGIHGPQPSEYFKSLLHDLDDAREFTGVGGFAESIEA
jgi:hypothetical protein